MPKMVNISNTKTGERFAVLLKDFSHGKSTPDKDGVLVSYEAAGFKIDNYEDGEEYESPPSRPAHPAITPEPPNA